MSIVVDYHFRGSAQVSQSLPHSAVCNNAIARLTHVIEELSIPLIWSGLVGTTESIDFSSTKQRYPGTDAKGDKANQCVVRCKDLNNVSKGDVETNETIRDTLLSHVSCFPRSRRKIAVALRLCISEMFV